MTSCAPGCEPYSPATRASRWWPRPPTATRLSNAPLSRGPMCGYARLHAVDQIGAGQRRLRAGCLWPQRLTPVPGWLGDRLFVVDRGRITAPATVPATDGSGTER